MRPTRTLRQSIPRRKFLENTLKFGTGIAASTLASASLPNLLGSSKEQAKTAKPGADSVIFIWLAGGMCHLDTFDPKDILGDGAKRPGSYYKRIPTAARDIAVCEHLPRMARWMDQVSLIRSMTHQFNEHSTAVTFNHTNRPPSGTVIYPSIGSVISHQLGPRDGTTPAYVVLGQPMIPRGPGFLGGKYGYLYVLDTEEGLAGLQPPYGRTVRDHQRREAMLSLLSESFYSNKASEPLVEAYEAVTRQGFGMLNQKFMDTFSVKNEPSSLKEAYGEDFGQRCLLSRKLVQGGIRFVECAFSMAFLNGFGWDAHFFAQKRVHLLIQQLDQSLSMLLEDLERHKLLERTLVVVATDFGRPPDFDEGGGRGHQCQGYTVVLAGGGIRGGRAIGRTDEIGREIVERPVSIPDLHATIYRALGMNLDAHLEAPGGRPLPITDFGQPVMELFQA